MIRGYLVKSAVWTHLMCLYTMKVFRLYGHICGRKIHPRARGPMDMEDAEGCCVMPEAVEPSSGPT